MSNQAQGHKGEEAAVRLLEQSGYRIIARNYRTRLGEIDIIAKDGGTVCFIEVKSRSSDRFGTPQEALSAAKQRKIAQVALLFLKKNGLLESAARFDVVSVLFGQGAVRAELIRNAFEFKE